MSTIIIISVIVIISVIECVVIIVFCRIPIHRVVFAGSFDYFKTAFGTHWTNNNTDTEVTFTVQQHEIVGFKAILKFFYTSILPEDMIIRDLLIMFRLCDVLICNDLIQKIETRLVTAS